MLDTNRDQAPLIEALEKLVQMADSAKFCSKDDLMTLEPASLDAICGESLFDDEDLQKLNDLIAMQHLLSQIRIAPDVGSASQPPPTAPETLPDYRGLLVSSKAAQIFTASPHKDVLQVPPKIVGQFGKVFVEVAVLMMMTPQWVFSFFSLARYHRFFI
jgi:hypothetical protein